VPILYLYALADRLSDISDLTGIQSERLELVAQKNAVVVAGIVERAPAVDLPGLKAQDALVRELHQRARALLPMRFGTTASDLGDLARLIEGRPGLLDRLAAVQGCEQMIARVVTLDRGDAAESSDVRSAAADSELPGTRYLESRARLKTASPELIAVSRAPGQLQRDVRVQPAHQFGLHGSVYHLIERGRAVEYRSAVDQAAAGLHGVRVIVTGPFPPYAFA
jgi:Gas vesicle synthesis protein GvpL/GvpF